MSDWRQVTLADVADIRPSNVDKLSIRGERQVRLCNYLDVYTHNCITNDMPFMEATASDAEIRRFRVEPGDILLTKDSETPDDIGIPAVALHGVDNLVAGYHLALLKPKAQVVDSMYLAKLLAGDATARYFSRRANGSTRYGLTRDSLAQAPVLLAPFEEQRSIAQVLMVVDGAIEGTEAMISKTQQIKAGLMHDLFTRGVLSDGTPRLLETSQRTPFGAIPRDWRLGGLLDVADPNRQPILTGPFGADLGNDDFVTEGVAVLRIGNVQAGWLDLSDLLFVTPRKADALRRYTVRAGDLLFARQGATTGRNALVSHEADGCLINYHIIRVALDPQNCDPTFIEAAFNEQVVKKQIERDKGRGTREGINTRQLTALRVPLADIAEQRRVGTILRVHASYVNKLTEELGNLRRLRAGLMRDLLTGRVRAPISGAELAIAGV